MLRGGRVRPLPRIPRAEAVLALLRSPLAQLLHATATGTLAEQPPLEWADGAAVTVVVAADGYPGRPRTGDVPSVIIWDRSAALPR